MKSKIIYIFWGAVFLAAGAGLLGGYDFAHLSQQFKLGFFAVISAGFFTTYYLEGPRKWVWLFPATICSALALLIGMELSGLHNPALESLVVFGCLAAPFYVGYAVNREFWGLLVPANLLAALMVFSMVVPYVNGAVATALVIFAIGLPFLVIYLVDRSRLWALITAAILAACSLMPLLGKVITASSDVKAAVFMTLFALGFFAMAIWSKNNWWALIPAGIFASFSLIIVLEILVPHQEYPSPPNSLSFDVYIWVLFLGLAATFGAVWLLRKTQPTGWAKYPAAGLLAIAVLSYIQGPRFQEIWPATVMVVIGALFLVSLFTRKQTPPGQQVPAIKA